MVHLWRQERAEGCGDETVSQWIAHQQGEREALALSAVLQRVYEVSESLSSGVVIAVIVRRRVAYCERVTFQELLDDFLKEAFHGCEHTTCIIIIIIVITK